MSPSEEDKEFCTAGAADEDDELQPAQS